jgi:hypothetical protein
MNPSNFDDLTKALANSTSRRHALRTIVTASVGSLLGVGGISTAFGRHRRRSKIAKPSGPPPGNSNCAKWCAQVFGPNTPAAGQCTSDAARGRGLCKECGSVAPSSICCVRVNGYCNGTAGACCSAGCPGCPTGQTCTTTGCCPNDLACNGVCCTSGQTCVNGSCCSNPCGSTCCGSSETCVNGSCCSNVNVCTRAPGLDFCCGSDETCCSGTCCSQGEICCGGRECCREEFCVNGMCFGKIG